MDNGVVLITGGSRGIGRALVERLCGDGLAVAFTWRSGEEAAREVEAVCQGRARGYHLEAADRERPAPLVATVEAELGPIHGLVNNAGMERTELLAMMSDESWDQVLDTNLGGAFRLTREVLRGGMVRRRRGAIVNVASLSALHGVAGHTAYAASKAGMVAMTRCLAREMGKRGIRVNAVVPGFVATAMTADVPAETVAKLRADECLSAGTAPAAVADTVVFLLSEHARAITGQVVVVDSGTSA
jgi:3-oxoacyl-[acyl-carrier protein] reductase